MADEDKPEIQTYEQLAERLERLTVPTPEQAAGVDAVSINLAVSTCPDCGIVFALPREFQIAMANKRGSVHCPSGHAISLSPASIGSGISQAYVRTVIELRRLTAELNRVKLQVARQQTKIDAATPVTPAEFKRRQKIMANRAERSGSRLCCTFCGGTYGTTYDFRRHIQIKHAEEVKSLPVSFFD